MLGYSRLFVSTCLPFCSDIFYQTEQQTYSKLDIQLLWEVELCRWKFQIIISCCLFLANLYVNKFIEIFIDRLCGTLSWAANTWPLLDFKAAGRQCSRTSCFHSNILDTYILGKPEDFTIATCAWQISFSLTCCENALRNEHPNHIWPGFYFSNFFSRLRKSSGRLSGLESHHSNLIIWWSLSDFSTYLFLSLTAASRHSFCCNIRFLIIYIKIWINLQISRFTCESMS